MRWYFHICVFNFTEFVVCFAGCYRCHFDSYPALIIAIWVGNDVIRPFDHKTEGNIVLAALGSGGCMCMHKTNICNMIFAWCFFQPFLIYRKRLEIMQSFIENSMYAFYEMKWLCDGSSFSCFHRKHIPFREWNFWMWTEIIWIPYNVQYNFVKTFYLVPVYRLTYYTHRVNKFSSWHLNVTCIVWINLTDQQKKCKPIYLVKFHFAQNN